MKVVAVMASHERVEITRLSCNSLKDLGCELVLVLTNQSDIKALKDFNPVHFRNMPLGAKWQYGVECAKKLNPDILLICGSDDILDKEYLNNALKLISKGYDFVGVSQWYMKDLLTGKLYKAAYKLTKDYPVGSGRVFNKKALDYLGWRLFDNRVDRRLDDFANNRVKTLNCYVSKDVDKDGLKITALKGRHGQMNPLNRFFNAPNIEICAVSQPH